MHPPIDDSEEVYILHQGGLIAVWPDGHVTALPAIPPTGKSPAAIMGSARSERKAASSRENGKRGGRPRKPSPTADV